MAGFRAGYAFSAILRYLATSGAKSDVIHVFLFGDPDFLQRHQNFAYISLSYRDWTWDRQKRRPKQKALTLTCASLINIEMRGIHKSILSNV